VKTGKDPSCQGSTFPLPDFRHKLDVSNREGGKLILDVFISKINNKKAHDWQRLFLLFPTQFGVDF